MEEEIEPLQMHHSSELVTRFGISLGSDISDTTIVFIYLGKNLSRSKYRLERIKIINNLIHRINRSVYEYEVMCVGKLK